MAALSVLIPCYNAERWISTTIESVLAQSFQDFELLVVDDCSTDGSAAVVSRYPRAQIIRHATNRGQAAALNTAIAAARGELVAFLDADDVWAPEKLERCVAALKNAAVVYSNGSVIDETGREQYALVPVGHRPPAAPDALLLDCYIRTPSSIVVRTSAIRDAGGFDTTLQAADHDMWLRLRERHDFAYVDEPLIGYRTHSGQISHRIRQWHDGFTILRKARARYPYSRRTLRKRLAVLHFRCAQHHWRDGVRHKALGLFALAAMLDPRRAIRTMFAST